MSVSSKKVVVIGNGFAGASLSQALDGKCDLTVISEKDGFLFIKYGGLRASVAKPVWIDRTLPPTSKQLKKGGKIVTGKVSSVDEQAKTVTLASGQSLPYDVLVVASGSRNISPVHPPASYTTRQQYVDFFTQQRAALATAQNVVIVGTGPVGLELAGELREFGAPNVKISVVGRADHILAETKSPLSAKGVASMTELLKKQNVDVYLKDEVTGYAVPSDAESSIVVTPNGVTLKSGKHIPCNILVYCVGSIVNTSFLPPAWLDPQTKEVEVEAGTLLVKGKKDVFALGDCAKTGFTKLGYAADMDGKVIAKNVLQVLGGKAPTNKISRPGEMMFVEFGSKHGRGITPWFIMGDYLVSLAKGRGLFQARTWGQLHAGAPPKA